MESLLKNLIVDYKDWILIKKFFKGEPLSEITVKLKPEINPLIGNNYKQKAMLLANEIAKSVYYIVDNHISNYEKLYDLKLYLITKKVKPINERNIKRLDEIISNTFNEKDNDEVEVEVEKEEEEEEEEEEGYNVRPKEHDKLISDLILSIQDSLYYKNRQYKFKSIPTLALSLKHKVPHDIVIDYKFVIKSLFFISNEELDTENRKQEYDSKVISTVHKTIKGLSPKALVNQIRYFKATDTPLIVKPKNIIGKNLTYNDAYRYLHQLYNQPEKPFVYTYNLKKFFKVDGIKDVIKYYTGIQLTTTKKELNYNLYLNNYLNIV